MRIGVVLAAYEAMDYLPQCLLPWIYSRQVFDIKIACVHGCFVENHENGEPILSSDDTHGYFDNLIKVNHIDYFYNRLIPGYEHEIRNHAVEFLLQQDVDFIWTIGADEIYTQEQIKKILSFVERNPLTTWFGVNYKNYVFTKTTWVDGFCPPRIFRVQTQNYKLNNFYWDDDIQYQGKITRDITSYKHFAHLQIPKTIAHVDHYTWLSDERSKKKVAYQEKHFGPPRGMGCSYKWNKEEDKLEFNLDFYKKSGQTIPELHSES